MFEYLLAGFANVFEPWNFLLMVFGTVVGVIIGCLPGLSGSMGIILLLPLTYTLPKSTALVMLCGIFCGSMFGGSVSAILLRTPGAPMVLGVILGPIAEKNLDRALQLSRNDWTIFFRRPIALTFILLSVGMIAWTVIGNIRDMKKADKA